MCFLDSEYFKPRISTLVFRFISSCFVSLCKAFVFSSSFSFSLSCCLSFVASAFSLPLPTPSRSLVQVISKPLCWSCLADPLCFLGVLVFVDGRCGFSLQRSGSSTPDVPLFSKYRYRSSGPQLNFHCSYFLLSSTHKLTSNVRLYMNKTSVHWGWFRGCWSPLKYRNSNVDGAQTSGLGEWRSDRDKTVRYNNSVALSALLALSNEEWHSLLARSSSCESTESVI